jgi:glycosyltransferase involved in cell wall biosynthesis
MRALRDKLKPLRHVIPAHHQKAIKQVALALEPYVSGHRSRKKIETLRKKLELGFYDKAQSELWDMATTYPRSERGALAALALLDHLIVAEGAKDSSRVRRCLDIVLNKIGQLPDRREAVLVVSHAYLALGETEAGQRLLEAELRKHPDLDLNLAISNMQGSKLSRMTCINSSFLLSKLTSVGFQDDKADADVLDTFEAGPDEGSIASGPLVSIIVYSNNNLDTISASLRSILAQSWKNLECLVVDADSTDGSRSIIEALHDQDARLKLISAPAETAEFVARNIGLNQARGDLVTTHGADEWAHPQKVEVQAQALDSASAVVSVSRSAAIDSDLLFINDETVRRLADYSAASMMFRREAIRAKLGYWDGVEFGADWELIERIKAEFGAGSIRKVNSLLSIRKHRIPSASARDAMRSYKEAAGKCHSSVSNRKYEFAQEGRPFAAPRVFIPKAKAARPTHYNVIIASDFRLEGGSTLSSIEEIKAQHSAGLKTAIVQMFRYDFDPQKAMNRKVARLVQSGAADLITSSEDVSCDLLVLRYPPILQEFQEFLPRIDAREVKVIINQPPMSDYGPGALVRYQIPKCVENCLAYFSTPGVWHPIGPLVRDAIHTHHPEWLSAFNLSDQDWVNIVDLREWSPNLESQRFTPARIGRHSRDHEMKWPGDKTTLRLVYPDDSSKQIWVLGGANVPARIYGKLPANWRVYKFDSISPREFLSQVDVFVYFTNDAWVESFGRVVIEAMAAGVPAVLPHSYKSLFQDAAIYADPGEVQSVVNRLISDQEFYRAQAKHALAYVDQNFGYSMHIKRVTAFKQGKSRAGVE